VKRVLLAVLAVVAAVALVFYDVDLFQHHLADVQGNLEASVIWGTPAALLFLWRSELRHRRRERAEQARHIERMQHLNSLHAKVDRLHAHLGVEPPAAD
jgi:hypothetical protein